MIVWKSKPGSSIRSFLHVGQSFGAPPFPVVPHALHFHDNWKCKACGTTGNGGAPKLCPTCKNDRMEEPGLLFHTIIHSRWADLGSTSIASCATPVEF